MYSSGDLCGLSSFPTRRSSDLRERKVVRLLDRENVVQRNRLEKRLDVVKTIRALADDAKRPVDLRVRGDSHRLGWYTRFRSPSRSEEHTSELQSRFDLVCRLLL